MSSNNEWMSISDLMAGLMLVFLFIAISFMLQVEIEKQHIQEIAITYSRWKKELNKDLQAEFNKDLTVWGAEITQDNAIIFNSPDVLFNGGESVIRSRFKLILDDFFPRYLKILLANKYKDEIDELRIEGHTSDVWATSKSNDDVYINNMRLSQARASSVLSYCYRLDNAIISLNKSWLEHNLRANGMAFSKMKFNSDNTKDYIRSRRVEFNVKMRTEEKIYKILNMV